MIGNCTVIYSPKEIIPCKYDYYCGYLLNDRIIKMIKDGEKDNSLSLFIFYSESK